MDEPFTPPESKDLAAFGAAEVVVITVKLYR